MNEHAVNSALLALATSLDNRRLLNESARETMRVIAARQSSSGRTLYHLLTTGSDLVRYYTVRNQHIPPQCVLWVAHNGSDEDKIAMRQTCNLGNVSDTALNLLQNDRSYAVRKVWLTPLTCDSACAMIVTSG